MKKYFLLACLFLLSACVTSEYKFCPKVVIPRQTAYLSQIVNYSNEYQIEIKGFEGYCYFDARVNRNKAVIAPIFYIKKLGPTDQTQIDFSYFLKLEKGPTAYIGKYKFSQAVDFALDEREKEVVGREVEIKVPNQNPEDFEVVLGLNISREENKYNNRTFDINYQYFDKGVRTRGVTPLQRVSEPKSSCNTCKL